MSEWDETIGQPDERLQETDQADLDRWADDGGRPAPFENC